MSEISIGLNVFTTREYRRLFRRSAALKGVVRSGPFAPGRCWSVQFDGLKTPITLSDKFLCPEEMPTPVVAVAPPVPDYQFELSERVGRLFHDRRMDTMEISRICHIDEPAAVRALHQFQERKRRAAA